MIELRTLLPFWMAGTELVKAANAAKAFYVRSENSLSEAVLQASIADCTEAALAEHARDRGIDRLPGEPVAQWRKRVQHAGTSAREAGSLAGLKAILTAHGLQGFTITERDPGQDWDVVLIELDPTQLTLDSDSLNEVLHRWGRPCRRYAPSYKLTASAGLLASQDRGAFYFGSAS